MGLGVQDLLELFFQIVLQIERVETFISFPQLAALLERQDARRAESLVSAPGRLIALAPVTALTPLALQSQPFLTVFKLYFNLATVKIIVIISKCRPKRATWILNYLWKRTLKNCFLDVSSG